MLCSILLPSSVFRDASAAGEIEGEPAQETSRSFRGKDVSSRSVGTMVRKKPPGGRRFVNIHWSSHAQEGWKP